MRKCCNNVGWMILYYIATISLSAFFNASIHFSGIIEYLSKLESLLKKVEFVFQVGRKNVEPSLLAGYSYICDLETFTSWRVI